MSSSTYLVCATQRSGSTLLCKALSGTGVAGRPAEYFEALEATGLPAQPRDYLPELGDELGLPALRRGDPLPPFTERLEAARRAGTTPNGIFGAKVMWSYGAPVLAALGSDPGVGWVLVRRRDKLRQAVSLWRAIQTQQWHADDATGGEPAYSRAAIDALRARLADEEAAWERWLADRNPLVLDYEEFASRPGDAVAAVLRRIGVETPADLAGAAPLRRQADALTEDWVRRHAA